VASKPLSQSELLARVKAVAATKPHASQQATYTVKSGDSLSTIAERVYHESKAWTVLYWANHSKIRYANEITPGQVLKVPAKPAKLPAAPGELGPAAAPATAPVSTQETYAPVQTTSAVSSDYSGSGYPGGSFGSCVVAAESGGNSQVMNASGHYGLYQFSASTWAAYGGDPSEFGDATVAEQNAVFSNALAAGGESNWSAYDGC